MRVTRRTRATGRPNGHAHGGDAKLSGASGGRMEYAVPTIVEYTDQKRPKNLYPERIISPPSSGPCCFSDMEEIGGPQEEGRWVFQYKRCRKCGFAVRVILREIPDAALAAELRKTLANSFVRNVPD